MHTTDTKGELTLLRHGESIWNQQNRFTGWVDVSLSRSGMQEATRAGNLLKDKFFDLAFTSSLLRAQDTLYEVLKLNQHCDQYMRIHVHNSTRYEHFKPSSEDITELKIYVTDALNERYYGDLQGVNKDLAKQEFGEEQVHIWRRSYDVPPPHGESLEMTARRVIPYYQSYIVPHLQQGQSVLISAHGNSLRALIMHIESMTPAQIIDYNLRTGSPHIYAFDSQMKLLRKQVLP